MDKNLKHLWIDIISIMIMGIGSLGSIFTSYKISFLMVWLLGLIILVLHTILNPYEFDFGESW